MPVSKNKQYGENSHELAKREQIIVKINGHSHDTGKQATILTVPATGKITTDTLVYVRMGKKIFPKRIKAFVDQKQVIEHLTSVR
jgi:hypothetical protein